MHILRVRKRKAVTLIWGMEATPIFFTRHFTNSTSSIPPASLEMLVRQRTCALARFPYALRSHSRITSFLVSIYDGPFRQRTLIYQTRHIFMFFKVFRRLNNNINWRANSVQGSVYLLCGLSHILDTVFHDKHINVTIQ